MQMVIVDPVAPRPYSSNTLREQSLGGTEATVIRIAESMDAIVLQHNRTENEGRYRTASSLVNPSLAIMLREPAAALQMAERYPHARKMLWLHDLAGPSTDRGKKLAAHAPRLAAAGITLVCVSDFHAADVRKNFLSLPETQRPQVIRIYNPVDISSVSADEIAYDPNKLVFFSSPHKGLDYALYVFSYLHSRNKHLRLYIANPGYLPGVAKQWPGVVNLGAVPHHIIMQHVRSALCTFYPNYVYPETFGLALAESNALGTPVLTHRIGAAHEVLRGEGQFIDIPRARGIADSVFWHWPWLRNLGEASLGMLGFSKAYEQRIRSWQQGNRPVVAGRTGFSIEAVVAVWQTAGNVNGRIDE